jgi:tRNA threonylcarbamoyladenosine biosynthesis protein TsaB
MMTHRLLSLETTGTGYSIALFEDGLLQASVHEPRLQQSDTLIPAVQGLLLEAGWRGNSLSQFAVCRGPGSFTGIRVGISAAYGLGLGFEKPVASFSALHALAYAASHQATHSMVVLIAADNNTGYVQSFTPTAEALDVPRHIMFDEVCRHLPTGDVHFVGNAWNYKPHLLEVAGNTLYDAPLTAVDIGQLCYATRPFTKEPSTPLYIKPPYAIAA